MENIIAIIVMVVWVGNLVVSLSCPILTVIINYVWRSKLNICCFEDWKGSRFNVQVFLKYQVLFYIVSLFIWLIVYFNVDPLLNMDTEVTESRFRFQYIITSVYYCVLPFILVGTLPLLRWLVDVSRNLKIKKSTGDSEKLESLQKQIDELKTKGDSNE